MLILLDPLYVTFTDQGVTVLPGPALDETFSKLAIVQQRVVARQAVAVKQMILTVLDKFERVEK